MPRNSTSAAGSMEVTPTACTPGNCSSRVRMAKLKASMAAWFEYCCRGKLYAAVSV